MQAGVGGRGIGSGDEMTRLNPLNWIILLVILAVVVFMLVCGQADSALVRIHP